MFEDLHVTDLQATLKTVGDFIAKAEERLAAIETKVAEVQRSEDERIAEFITPDWTLGIATKTAGDDSKELVDRLKQDADRKIVDDKTKNESPLQFGLWSQLVSSTNGG